jgi:hypothetical protein
MMSSSSGWIDRRAFVRAEVTEKANRDRFDHWYATDHLPLAVKTFGRGGVGAAGAAPIRRSTMLFYEFDDPKQAEAATAPDRIKPLIADFDRVWGDRVSRRREILEIVQEMAG